MSVLHGMILYKMKSHIFYIKLERVKNLKSLSYTESLSVETFLDLQRRNAIFPYIIDLGASMGDLGALGNPMQGRPSCQCDKNNDMYSISGSGSTIVKRRISASENSSSSSYVGNSSHSRLVISNFCWRNRDNRFNFLS